MIFFAIVVNNTGDYNCAFSLSLLKKDVLKYFTGQTGRRFVTFYIGALEILLLTYLLTYLQNVLV